MKNNQNIKILMLLESSFPPDIRVEKEVNALIESGFDVDLICANNGTQTNIEIWNGMKIYRLPKKNKLSILRSLIFTIQKDYFIFILQHLKNNCYDAIHVHDLKLVPTALEIKKTHDIKVIADFHENYPEGVREWTKLTKGIKKIINLFFNSYNKWIKIEKEVVFKVDYIIAVVLEMKEKLLLKHTKLDPNKIVVVSNLEDINFIKYDNLDYNLIDKYKNFFTIVYVGGFGMHRGLDTAIKGMKLIKESSIKLILVGKGSKEITNYLEQLVVENNLTDKVIFEGWQPFHRVLSYQKLADICIVPHNSNEHTDNTIPHKLYQYMMVGKPIIVSSCKPLARVVKDAKAGLVFEAGNETDFAQCVEKLYLDMLLRKELGENGLIYTFEKNNTWQEESKKLIEFYRGL
ncbi:glycosyltransferase family 4 protein [Aliarcobacter skirrowii]|uniref:glycosyltransferase family 4 protein n=1 Tax=Aliarcobacter skirrowii TaxID=28200 RepID=UPI0029B890D1|nr:glycosyltransferase family 4 protein [Aliarcobacter skirrowii]MDX4059288.1 glycosyltransferase family 4 protein [Aliarcobacter skirrowii]